MGFSVFQGDSLIRYGVKNLGKQKLPERILTKGKHSILDLIQRFSPKVLVLGKVTHPSNRKNPVLRKLVTHIKLLARKSRIRLYEYEPHAARKLIADGNKPTKRNTAKLIASLYPELSEYVPRKIRLLWKERDFYWVNVFDACTLALAHLEKERGEKGDQRK